MFMTPFAGSIFCCTDGDRGCTARGLDKLGWFVRQSVVTRGTGMQLPCNCSATRATVLGIVADAQAASGVRRDKNRAGCPRFTLQTGDGDLDSKFSVLISRTAKISKRDVKRLRTSGCIMQVPAPRLATPPTPPTPSRPVEFALPEQASQLPPALRVFEALQPRASETCPPVLCD